MKILKLDLEKELPEPSRMSWWPLVDLCVIGLFVAVFGSKFVIPPSLTMDLPQLKKPQIAIAAEYHVVSIDEVEGEEMILYEDTVHNLETFRKRLDKRGKVTRGTTLLVRADAAVSMQTLSSLFEIAQEMGYQRIQFATEKRQDESSPFGEP